MTITTLEFIHKQLIEAKTAAEETYTAAKKLLNEYRASEASEELICSQRSAVNEYAESLNEARDALADFESREW